MAYSLRVGDCKAAPPYVSHGQPRRTAQGMRQPHPVRLSGSARPPASWQRFQPKMFEELLRLVLALRSLAAFDVGLGMPTSLLLVRMEDGGALRSSVDVVYVRQSTSGCRPFRGQRTSAPTPSVPQKSLPEVPGMYIFGCPASRILRGAAPDRAVFSSWRCFAFYGAREAHQERNGRFLRDFDTSAMIKT